MIGALLHACECIHQCNIDQEPKEVVPPFARRLRGWITIAQLVGTIDPVHLQVVTICYRMSWHHDCTSIPFPSFHLHVLSGRVVEWVKPLGLCQSLSFKNPRRAVIAHLLGPRRVICFAVEILISKVLRQDVCVAYLIT